MDRSASVAVGATAPIRYLALGDSFTIGTGIAPESAFPALLARRWTARGIRCDLVNPSVNGFTTDDLIRAELPLLARLRPTLLTLLIGANDIVGGSSEERYRAQLRRIHDAVRAAAVDAAAVYALPQPDWSLSPAGAAFGDPGDIARTIERFNLIAHEEAERRGSRYIDLFPLMRRQAQAAMLAADGLHPSAEAHAQWAEELDRVLIPGPPPGSPPR
jgi:lysophospholipase L1-like esterase